MVIYLVFGIFFDLFNTTINDQNCLNHRSVQFLDWCRRSALCWRSVCLCSKVVYPIQMCMLFMFWSVMVTFSFLCFADVLLLPAWPSYSKQRQTFYFKIFSSSTAHMSQFMRLDDIKLDLICSASRSKIVMPIRKRPYFNQSKCQDSCSDFTSLSIA